MTGSSVKLLFAIRGASVLAGIAWVNALTGTALAAGGFTGAFAITDVNNGPGNYSTFSLPTGPKLGEWTWTLTPGGSIDTTGAPDSINLQASPPPPAFGARGGVAPMGESPGTAIAQISIVSPAAGFFSFDYSFEVGQLEVFSTGGGLQTLTMASSGQFEVELSPGEVFLLRVLGTPEVGFQPASSRGVAQLAAPGNQYVTINNAIFVVPETSTWMAGFAAVGLIGWRLSQRRRQA